MPFVAVPEGYKVEHKMEINGHPIVNVMGAQSDAVIDQTDLNTYAGEHADSWIANIMAQLPAPCVYLGCTITSLATVDGIQAVASRHVAGSGSTSDLVPPSLCACLTLRTSERSRRGRGRVYISFLDQGRLSTSDPTMFVSSAVTAFTDALGSYLGDVRLTLPLAVISRADALARVVTDISMDTRVDHQRRRDG